MDGIVSKLRTKRVGNEPRRLHVVAAYEDAVTDARVNEFCRVLARQLGCRFEVIRQMWLLNELRVPQLRTVASHEGATADLLIVSIHNSEQIPQEVQVWIEAALASKGKNLAMLISLLDPERHGDASALRAFLQRAAAKAGVESLFQCAEAAAPGVV